MDISIFVWTLVIPSIIVIALAAVFFVFKNLKEFQQKNEILPYRAKRFFFSRSEQEFLRVLNSVIDHKRFTVFPKVRLADFIEVTADKSEYQSAWNRIRSKHVDFLIWDMDQLKISVAIELDGSSHNSEKMQARDDFVEKLYATVGMRLERVQIGENFESASRRVLGI